MLTCALVIITAKSKNQSRPQDESYANMPGVMVISHSLLRSFAASRLINQTVFSSRATEGSCSAMLVITLQYLHFRL